MSNDRPSIKRPPEAPEISVVIPCYREAERLKKHVPAIVEYLQARKLRFEIIVVDDGSPDDTAAVARTLPVKLISYQPNRGKGGAVKEGMLAAEGKYVLFTDADQSTPISEMEKLLAALKAGNGIAIGSRAVPGAAVKEPQVWYRALAGKLFGLGTRLLCLRGIHDTQCGFKMFTQQAAQDVFRQVTSTTAIFDIEVLAVAAREGYKIAEVPVQWVHDPDTRIPYDFKRALRIWAELFRIRQAQHIGWPLTAEVTNRPKPSILPLHYALLALIVAVGAWLRLSRLDLLEFKGDEAVAAMLALKFVKGGELPLAGLMSSVGVTNPPLFIYLLIPAFFLTTSIAAVTCYIALTGLAAVVIAWHVGRKYYGPVTGLVAAALMATAPWAVIYSRKIWAQDFVPLFAVATFWAVHAVVLGKKPKAIFWALFLPLCVIQIHFSGLALTATVVAILLLTRTKINWRWAGAGVAVAVVLLLPYLKMQSDNQWADFRKAAATVGGKQYEGRIPPGMTVHPDLGYALPRQDSWVHALSIMNAGQIEDILGLSARQDLDRSGVWRQTRGGSVQYFADLSWFNWVLVLARVAVVGAFVFLAVEVARGWKTESGRRALIPLLWLAGPVAVFVVARLWTYLSYFVILYPAHFIVLGAGAERLAAKWKRAVVVIVAALALANIGYLLSLYDFLGRYGGAHGTYGTVLAQKQDAVDWLNSRADVRQLMAERRIVQVDRLVTVNDRAWVLVEAPQQDLPLLAALADRPGNRIAPLPANALVLVVDQNRANFDPGRLTQWPLAVLSPQRDRLIPVPYDAGKGAISVQFGAMWIVVVQR